MPLWKQDNAFDKYFITHLTSRTFIICTPGCRCGCQKIPNRVCGAQVYIIISFFLLTYNLQLFCQNACIRKKHNYIFIQCMTYSYVSLLHLQKHHTDTALIAHIKYFMVLSGFLSPILILFLYVYVCQL